MSDISVVVLGGVGVGKSCLVLQYMQGRFLDHYDATIEDVYRKTLQVDDRPTTLTVIDTAGQQAFGAMQEQYLKKGHGFVLVYSITDAESFQHIRRTYADLHRVRVGRFTPCVVVASKADEDECRVVSRVKGAQLAADIGAPFLEITAKDHCMCEEVFCTLVHAIRHSGGPSASQSSITPRAMDSSSHQHHRHLHNGASNALTASAASPPVAAADDDAKDTAASPAQRKHRHRKCSIM